MVAEIWASVISSFVDQLVALTNVMLQPNLVALIKKMQRWSTLAMVHTESQP